MIEEEDEGAEYDEEEAEGADDYGIEGATGFKCAGDHSSHSSSCELISNKAIIDMGKY